MLVTRNRQPFLWESVLPAEVRRMAPLLEQVDRWLDDEAFFAPFREHFSVLVGRPSIPMEVYLRMMFLKFQCRLGHESLCREVSDSISWRIFCRLNIDGSVPAPSTLSKITTRCGEDAVLRLNAALLARADAAKLVKTGKVRADTTVVSANVEYPTDSGLLARAVTLVGKLVKRIKAAGGVTRTAFRDATEEATARVHAIGAKLKLRGAEAKEEAQDRQPARRRATRPRDQARPNQTRPYPRAGGRRPRLRRGQCRQGTRGTRRADGGHPPQGQARQSPPGPRALTRVPRPRQMANRMRRPHQPPQTPIRLGSQPRRRARTHRNLVRLRRSGPQPRQGRPPGGHRMRTRQAPPDPHSEPAAPSGVAAGRRPPRPQGRFSGGSS